MAQEFTNVRPLPATREQLLAQRSVKGPSTLLGHIDLLHVELWSDSKYRALFEAVKNENAVEGSMIDDVATASHMIRDLARKKNIEPVVEAKLREIRRTLGSVKRRYNLSRAQRLNGHAASPV